MQISIKRKKLIIKKITVDFIIDTCMCNMVMLFSLEFRQFFAHIHVHVVVLFTQNLHF